VLQVGVQRTPDPGVIGSHNIRSNPPGSKNVVLDHVGSRALFALGERGQNRILPRAPESIAELQVILAFDLADTDFFEICLILRANARNDLSLESSG
jgi:hypothetical protein